MREIKILAVHAAAAVAVGAWAPVFGQVPQLTSIGVLDSTQPYSSIQAVSSDGNYVVGTSTAPGGTIRVQIIWSPFDGLLALPNPSGANSVGIGVAVGVGANAGNIIIAGLHEGNLTQRYYKTPLNNLASGSWVDCASAGGLPTSDMRGGMYNDLRNAVPVAGWPPSGAWYIAGKQASNGRDARLRGDPMSGWNGSSVNNVASVSAYGVIVGRSVNSGTPSVSSAYYDIVNVGFYTVPGSSGYRADGFGISSSFGNSTDYGSQWISGQVLNYNGTSAQGFRWMRGDASMTFLGTLSGDASSVAYTVADNGLTAGYSYLGTRGYTAVVWDTTGEWDSTGTAQSVKDLLTAKGVDTSMWTSLNRVYAVSDDGGVLAGIGIWAADGSTRGFVAAKPVVRITHISWSSPNVVIDFTSNTTADTTVKFTVQQAGTLVNTATVFADVIPAATITGSAGSFQATFAPTANPQFYRINRLP